MTIKPNYGEAKLTRCMTKKLSPGDAVQEQIDRDGLSAPDDIARVAIDAAVAAGLVVRVEPSVLADERARWQQAHELWKKLQPRRGAGGAVVENPEGLLMAALDAARGEGYARGRADEEKWTDAWDVKFDTLTERYAALERAARDAYLYMTNKPGSDNLNWVSTTRALRALLNPPTAPAQERHGFKHDGGGERACVPADDAAEREHCERFAYDFADRHSMHVAIANELAFAVMRERKHAVETATARLQAAVQRYLKHRHSSDLETLRTLVGDET